MEQGAETVKLHSRSRYGRNPVVERRRVMAVQWVGLVGLVAVTGYLVMRAFQAT